MGRGEHQPKTCRGGGSCRGGGPEAPGIGIFLGTAGSSKKSTKLKFKDSILVGMMSATFILSLRDMT